ncbi:DUF3231 family protein [Salipaludibacillus neizhouensis]|uniref:DUF3231 family protein n=1 Tax=Salipaludibacillus neizhouensis TaxID=885475 RepID=UPI00217E3644|nr:DUF3231 family protein [Salipaludibacillus neizhouensis]
METNTFSETEKEVLGQIKEHQQNKMLNASELGDLFSNYLGDSLFSCVFEHHLQVVEDDEIKDFLKFALDNSQKKFKDNKRNLF